jgi:hypothetical protein
MAANTATHISTHHSQPVIASLPQLASFSLGARARIDKQKDAQEREGPNANGEP